VRRALNSRFATATPILYFFAREGSQNLDALLLALPDQRQRV
jgi:hypothetical protein